MTHEEALNRLLSNQCPSNIDGETSEFTIELCCIEFNIAAKELVPFYDENGEFDYMGYEILSMEVAKYEA